MHAKLVSFFKVCPPLKITSGVFFVFFLYSSLSFTWKHSFGAHIQKGGVSLCHNFFTLPQSYLPFPWRGLGFYHRGWHHIPHLTCYHPPKYVTRTHFPHAWPLMIFCGFHSDPLPFQPTHGEEGGWNIWWDCSCLILLPSLWSVINFLLSPSLPVLPSLFQSPILKPPKVVLFFFSYWIRLSQPSSSTPSPPLPLPTYLPTSLPSFLALIFSPACIQRKRRRSHSSTHDWPQPVS